MRNKIIITPHRLHEIEDRTDLMFICDGQEVEEVKSHLPKGRARGFSSYFVKVEDGDYSEVYGLDYGIVPYLYKWVYKIEWGLV
jgi:hypothetical protein